METKIEVGNLNEGMYVCRLDRPWLETPFLIQGFYVTDQRDIELLGRYCKFVFVDTDAPSPQPQAPTASRAGSTRSAQPLRLPKPTRFYEDVHGIEDEIGIATELRKEIASAVTDIMRNVREGKRIQITDARTTVRKMTESILRNPDAFMWLRLLKDRDTYTYSHCMDSSALAISFGRTLGLGRHELDDLGMGMLMCDIGKVRLPAAILDKPGPLTHEEYKIIQQHVAHSVDIMQECGNFSKASIDIAATHHERVDGSGYPRGLRGADVSMLGRMAAIVDCFDAITSATPYRDPISSHEAIRRLYEWRGNHFQSELVEQFIQTLGTYPVGTIVALSSKQVGIVLAQNRSRRLRPRVLLVLDQDGKRYDGAPVVDLIKETETPDGRPLEVSRVLEPGAFGIDPVEFYL